MRLAADPIPVQAGMGNLSESERNATALPRQKTAAPSDEVLKVPWYFTGGRLQWTDNGPTMDLRATDNGYEMGTNRPYFGYKTGILLSVQPEMGGHGTGKTDVFQACRRYIRGEAAT